MSNNGNNGITCEFLDLGWEIIIKALGLRKSQVVTEKAKEETDKMIQKIKERLGGKKAAIEFSADDWEVIRISLKIKAGITTAEKNKETVLRIALEIQRLLNPPADTAA